MTVDAETTTGETERLCRFVADTTYADLPDDVVDHATRMVLDSLGVTLAGTETEAATIARAAKTGVGVDAGPARVPGTALSGTPRDVALATGVAAHALDFDDVHHRMGGHPSTPVLSALLPVAEAASASGADLLTAFVLGVETETTLADVLNPGHYERGWHPTAVLGSVGAAVAVGKLHGLDARRLRWAVGIAASEAGGIKANFGTMTKPLHVGNAARTGVEAAALAAEGFTASETSLEATFGGFCDLFEGDPGHDFADHLDQLGSPWGLLDPPVGFKPYPCCGSAHGAIDAAIAVRDRHEFDVADVDRVTVEAHPRRLDHTNDPAPETPLDAKFSTQYCVAVALLHGDVWLDHFEEAAVGRPATRSLLDLVDVTANREAFEGREWGARVTVVAGDERHAAEVDAPTGGAENPLTGDELEEKYRRCVADTLDDERARQSLATLADLADVPDVSSVLDRLTVA